MLRVSISIAVGLVSAFVSCKTVDSSPNPAPGGGGVKLSDSDADAIGRKIWKNECNGTVEGLTTWNAGEDFPSLGIGHFIWYVPGKPGPFEESFPPLIQYMQGRGVKNIPAWVAEAKGSPWSSRSEFLAQQNSPRMKELRQFLAGTVSVQTGFIVRRLENALPKMKAATPAGDRDRLQANFYKVAETRTGVYALIDYVNFKGEGTKPEESYQGQGWGLQDVLLDMKDTAGGKASADEFSEAAKRVLQRRVRNAPASRNESRWLAGWMNRCESYKHGF